MASISLTKSFPPMTKSVLTITESSRVSGKTTLNFKFDTNLVYSDSFSGAGITYVATVKISGTGITAQTKNYTLKNSNDYWGGTSLKTSKFTDTFNVPSNVNKITITVTYKYSDEATTMTGSTDMNLTKLVSLLNPIAEFNDVDKIKLSISKYDNNYTQKLKVYQTTNNLLLATRNGVENEFEFYFIEEELNNLYNNNPTSSKIDLRFDLITYNGTTELGSTNVITKVNITDANPIFENFNYEDSNAKTLELTGDSSKIIKNYSTLKIIVPTEYKAIPKKGASIVNYVGGDKSAEYKEEEVSFEIPNYENNAITISAVDTRGNSTKVTKSVDLINYSEIAITSLPSISRVSSTNEETKINIEGTFWNNSFGAKNNELKVTYKYKEAGSYEDFQEGITQITPVIDGNNFKIEEQSILGDTDAGFDSDKSYNIVILITDGLFSYEIEGTLQAGKPGFALYGNKISLGDKYDEELGGNVQLWGDVYLNKKKLGVTVQACNQCITNDEEYLSGDYIPFTKEIYNNSDGLIVFNADGTITINHTGYIKASFGVWCHGGYTDVRPWIYFKEVNKNNLFYACIDDNSSNFVSLTMANCIVKVTEGDTLAVVANTSNNHSMRVNTYSGGKTSYMTIEIVE